MSPIDVGITMSKVKVTGALNVRMISAHYLENYLSKNLHIPHIYWSYIVDDPTDFGVTISMSMSQRP
jgi:hypothetical protein